MGTQGECGKNVYNIANDVGNKIPLSGKYLPIHEICKANPSSLTGVAGALAVKKLRRTGRRTSRSVAAIVKRNDGIVK
jgi:hypothetical protein